MLTQSCDPTIYSTSGDKFAVREGRQTELRNVQTFALHFFRNAQRNDSVHDFKDHEGKHECVQYDQRGSPELRKELGYVPVKQAGHTLSSLAEVRRCADTVPACPVGTIGEDTDANRPQPAAIAVHGDGTAGVVDLEYPLVKKDPYTNQNAGKNADDNGGVRANKCTRRGDGDQTSEHAVACHTDVGFAKLEVPEDHCCCRSGNSSKIRVHGNDGDAQVRRAKGGAGVKTHPAEQE